MASIMSIAGFGKAILKQLDSNTIAELEQTAAMPLTVSQLRSHHFNLIFCYSLGRTTDLSLSLEVDLRSGVE